jgi:hypothetical protein
MNDEIFRKIFGLLAFIGIVALWTLLWYMVGFHNGKNLIRFVQKDECEENDGK